MKCLHPQERPERNPFPWTYKQVEKNHLYKTCTFRKLYLYMNANGILSPLETPTPISIALSLLNIGKY